MKTERMGQKKDVVHLLFLGSPLLDITSHCSQETLDSYGLKSDDCIRETDRQEVLFRSLLSDPESQLTAGGSSQNSARIAKWTLGERADVAFAGCVGKDDFADTMRNRLQTEGVEPLYIPLPGESTGICVCLLKSESDRSMCARLGAAEHFAPHHLRTEAVAERAERADCIYVEGYFFAHSPNVMLTLADTCPENQLFSISLSAEYICREYTATLMTVLPRVDILLSNEAEAKVLAESLKLGDIEVEEIASFLATKDRPPNSKPRIVLVTRGPNPVLVAQGSEPLRHFPIPSGVKVIDSVGCGDAMAGAFLAVYLLTGDLPTAVKTGILAATEIAQVPGCNPTGKKLYPL